MEAIFFFQEKKAKLQGEMINKCTLKVLWCSCHLQIEVSLLASSHFLGNFSSIIPASA